MLAMDICVKTVIDIAARSRLTRKRGSTRSS